MAIALLYEHPTWSQAVIARAHERELAITPIDVATHDFTLPIHGEFDLWVNRVNAMPSAGRPASVVAATGHLLLALELASQKVINGAHTHRVGGSKAAQAALFGQLGLSTPVSIGIHQPADAIRAARMLGFPVLTKPNAGGSGSGVMRYDSLAELQEAVDGDLVDLGSDGTGVVQRIIESADGLIHRVEMLGDQFFYGTQQPLQTEVFNYCAIDGSANAADDGAINLFTPRADIIEAAAQTLEAAQAQVGGVEYIVDMYTGEPTFYDFNPYSNFVSGFDDELGFNPIDRYLDYLLSC